MKQFFSRILAVTLALCLLFSMMCFSALADSEEKDLLSYEDAIKRLGSISLTDQVELDLIYRSFSAIGAQYFATQYKYVTEALLKLCNDENVDFKSIEAALTILLKNSAFTEDYLKNKSLSYIPLDSLLAYVKARELEVNDSLQKAYEAYSANQILDSLDRAVAIGFILDNPSLTSTPVSTPKETPTAAPTSRPKDSEPPVIESFQCTPDSVEAPAKVKVTARISDNVGVKSAEVALLLGTQYVMSTQMSYNKSTSLWEGTLNLHNTIRESNYNIEITAYDESSNKANKTSRALKIINPNQDNIPPSVSNVFVTPNPVPVSSSLKISAEITDNLQRITYVECFLLYNGIEMYNSRMLYNYSAKQ